MITSQAKSTETYPGDTPLMIGYLRELEVEHSDVIYQRVEYIQSTGTQYINTKLDLFSTDNHRIVLDFAPTQFYNFNTLWGSSYNGDTYEAWVYGDKKLAARYNKIRYGSDNSLTLNTRYLLDLKKENTSLSKYVNNSLIGTGTSSSKKVNSSFYLFLSGTDYGKYKLYSCQLYRDDVLLRDFVPVYRKKDNIAGLYDTVNDVFYTNAATSGDDFTVGPDV